MHDIYISIMHVDVSCAMYRRYPLPSRSFWGESAVGTWTVAIADLSASYTGCWQAWSIEVNGAMATTSSSSNSTTYTSSHDALSGWSYVPVAVILAMMVILLVSTRRTQPSALPT